MRHAAIDELHFLDAALDRRHGAVHFRNHPLAHDAGRFQFRHFARAQMAHQGIWVARLAEQPRDVTHKNKPARLEPDRGPRRGDVRVAIINEAVLAARGGADHRRDTAPDAFAQRFDIYFANFADEPEIDRAPVFVVRRKFPAPENLGPGEPARFATELLDRRDDFRIDLPGKDIV